MKHTLALVGFLIFSQAAFAGYPQDAAQRFKMKYGIDHPVVVQEARAAIVNEAKSKAWKDDQRKMNTDEAKNSVRDKTPTDEGGRD